MSIYMWRDGSGGPGPSMRFSVCQGSIGSFTRVIGGSRGIATTFLMPVAFGPVNLQWCCGSTVSSPVGSPLESKALLLAIRSRNRGLDNIVVTVEQIFISHNLP